VVKDGSDLEAEPEDNAVENEENGEPDEEVQRFCAVIIYLST